MREAAANAFDFLVRKSGGTVVDQILPSMLQTLSNGGEEARKSFPPSSLLPPPFPYLCSFIYVGRAMNGLRELIAVRGHMVLPVLVPSLTSHPITPFKVLSPPSFSPFPFLTYPLSLRPMQSLLSRLLLGPLLIPT